MFDSVYIDNNTIISGTNGYCGIIAETCSLMTNFYMRNNIIQGFGQNPILYSMNTGTPNGSTHYIQDNLFYSNGSNTVGFSSVSVNGINYTPAGGYISTSNPGFVSSSDFHLTGSSSAIGSGIHITIPATYTSDYAGNSVATPPSLGAYEYTTVTPTPTSSIMTTPSITPTLTVTPSVTPTKASGTTYYIATAANGGSDSHTPSQALSPSTPWLTLAHACANTTYGNIIHVTAGSYTLTSQVVLPVGVSIEGDGMSTTTMLCNISTSYAGAIYIAAGSEGTNGNQHISGIYFDGNSETTYCAMWVWATSNVSVYNCTFINFANYGLRFHGYINGGSPSTSVNYAINNSVHDCVITNCAYYQHGVGGGADIYMDCQTGFLCHDNTITQSRTAYTNGCGVKTNGWTRGLQIYNNTITGQLLSDKNVTDSWDFAIEMWGDYGSVAEGIHIYNNNIYNWEIDISGRVTQKGSYAYGCSIHDNFISSTSFCPYLKIGIILEANISLDSIWIYHNHIKWVGEVVNLYMTPYNTTDNTHTSFTNIFIFYNIIDQIGYNTSGNSGCSFFNARAISDGINSPDPLSVLNHLYIYNNVILGTTVSGASEGACINIGNGYANAFSYIYLINNIITTWAGGPLATGAAGTMDHLYIQDNIFNGNGNSNTPVISMTNTNYTISGNLTTTPPFVSTSTPDYHLTSARLGLAVTLPADAGIDYGGTILNTPPTIGAYEYGIPPSSTPTPSISITSTPTPSITPTHGLSPTPTPSMTPTPSLLTSTLLSGLLGYWKLDESSGNAADASGNGNTGTSSNISYVSGKINNCYTFNGSSSKVAFGNVIKPTAGLSIAGWLKTTASTVNMVMLDCHTYGTGWEGYTFYFNGSNQLAIILGNNTGSVLDYETNPSITAVTIADGSWHFCAATWDGANVYLYLDSYTSSASPWANTIVYDAANSLNMGYDNSNTQWSNGSLDEIGIWNRALTTGEVAALYNGGTGKQHPFS
jgi:hypothetical protein